MPDLEDDICALNADAKLRLPQQLVADGLRLHG
jgi:hypothetical protein